MGKSIGVQAAGQSMANSRRRFLMMGLVATGVAKTSVLSDSATSDSLISTSFAGGREDDRAVNLGSAAPNSRHSGIRLLTNDPGTGAYTGAIPIELFNGAKSPQGSYPRFDTPPPGTRQRLRRRKARRRKIKRVVDHVVDFIFPTAHAAPKPVLDIQDARLYIEIDESGRWGVAFSSTNLGQPTLFVGTAESTSSSVVLDPAGPGCEHADPELDIDVSLLAVDDASLHFSLTAHHGDIGLAFASFGQLPRTDVKDDRLVANWCRRSNDPRRSPFFP